MGLNVKRRKFCREYMVDGNGTQAAIRAGYSRRSAYAQANQLLNILEVKEELARLEAVHAKSCEISREKVTGMMIEDRDLARRLDKPSAAVAASIGLARVNGLINEGAPTVSVKLDFGGMLAELEERRSLPKDVTPVPPVLEHESG